MNTNSKGERIQLRGIVLDFTLTPVSQVLPSKKRLQTDIPIAQPGLVARETRSKHSVVLAEREAESAGEQGATYCEA